MVVEKIRLQNPVAKEKWEDSPQRSWSGLRQGTESSHPGSRENNAIWKGWKEGQLESLGRCKGFSSPKKLKYLHIKPKQKSLVK